MEDLFLITAFVTYHTSRNWSQDMEFLRSEDLEPRDDRVLIFSSAGTYSMHCTATSKTAAIFKSFLQQFISDLDLDLNGKKRCRDERQSSKKQNQN